MKSIKPFLFIGLVIIMLQISCAKIYYGPECFSLAHNQKIVAIVFPKVSISPIKDFDAETIKEQQKTASLNFQKNIYAWMLKRKMQGEIRTEIQEIETTNAKLIKAGHLEHTLPPNELCTILNVDGLILSNCFISKASSERGTIPPTLLSGGVVGSINEVVVSMSIHDGKSQKLIWNYNFKHIGDVGSSPSKFVDGLMEDASKNMPYIYQLRN